VYAQAVAVARTPRQAFLVRGYELAVRADDSVPRADRHECAVHGGAHPLGDPDVREDPEVAYRFGDRAQVRAVEIDRGVQVGGVCALVVGIVRSRATGVLDPERIAGQERLGKCEQAHVLRRCPAERLEHFRVSGGRVEPGAAQLSGGDSLA
jgi:hypothetical protein